ncbi:MAG: hypothetical protein NT121_23420, partial [Chloroflexi bacterium]|nr:hypothetical protein [Chloroflexota bacterium]
MKQPVRIILLIISLLSISASNSPEDGASETIQAGLLRARVGENGWYTSDVVIPLLFPPGVTANGQPVPGGQLTVSAEGRHEIQLAPPGPHGADNAVTQFVNIDKSAPLVSWITAPNTLFSGRATLSADVTDEVSGI